MQHSKTGQRPAVYTIGHSTRTQGELIDILQHHGIPVLLDIRAIPYSRYNPQFNRETMMEVMPGEGIHYEHIEALGGHRPSPEVMKAAKSCSDRSHGFAEYMKSEEFQRGLDRVIELAASSPVALMCGEREPEHCHRFWVADALRERGIEPQHLIHRDEVREHPMNLFSFGS
jgi:uncharacterized protein (DUF488 family)